MDTLDSTTPCKSDYKDNVLIYIAGYIQRKVLAKESCVDCVDQIKKMQRVSSDLIDIKDRGGLIIPSEELVKLVKICYRDILLVNWLIYHIYVLPSILLLSHYHSVLQLNNN